MPIYLKQSSRDLTREMYILILRHGENLKKCFENINKKSLNNFNSEKRQKYEEKVIEDKYTSFIKYVYGKKMYYSDYRNDDIQFIYKVNFETNLITFENSGVKILKKHKFKDILNLDVEDLETKFNEESESSDEDDDNSYLDSDKDSDVDVVTIYNKKK